jgi:hypothetical protein
MDQFSNEIYFTERLRQYPHQTASVEEADVVFVPLYVMTDYLFAFTHSGLRARNRTLSHDALNTYVTSDLFRRHYRKIGVFCDGWLCQVDRFKSTFMHMIASVVHLTTNAFRFHNVSSSWHRHVSVPALANAEVRDTVNCSAALNHNRNISVFFRGAMGQWQPRVRAVLRGLPWDRIGAIYDVTSWRFEYLSNSTALEDVSTSYSDTMRNSRWCLILAGNGPTSRRMWDALLSGCVHITISNAWRPFLPFQKHIPWDAISITLNDTLPGPVLFDQISAIVHSDRDRAMRERIVSLLSDFTWGWGSPFLDEEGGFGHVADLTLADFYAAVRDTPNPMPWLESL